MCGISALIKKEDFINISDTNLLNSIVKNLNHRGPDEKGIKQINNTFLGMTRLSIIDIKNGSQPMSSKCGNYTIVYNGELYNYLDLKKELQVNGVSFFTNSDTEVVLNSYIYWGDNAVSKFNGMFAIIIHDKSKNLNWIARDRLGKKPLYIYEDNKKYLISSEVRSITKAINEVEGLSFDHDYQSYWDYLTYRYIPGERTSHKNIKKILPSSIIKIQNKQVTKETYYSLPSYRKSDNYKKANLHKLIKDAVNKRLISDVPLGIVLSGGLDSSIILYEASKKQKIESFHVAFESDNSDYNETYYAQNISQHCNSNLNILNISETEFFDDLEKFNFPTDEPISDLSTIPFNRLCALANKKVKVLLSGEGADEIFAGYGLHNVQKEINLIKLLNISPASSNFLLKIYSLLKGKLNKASEYTNYDYKNWPIQNLYNITNQISDLDKLNLMKINNSDIFLRSERILEGNYKKVIDEEPVDQILKIITKDWLVENVLMKSDKVSMHNSIEIRCPFLDINIVNYMFSTNIKNKINLFKNKLIGKYNLRKLYFNKIPNEIIYRKKLGFPVPYYSLREKKSQEFVYEILSNNNSFLSNIFDLKKIKLFIDRSLSENNDQSKYFLWSLAIYELWIKNKTS